MSQIATFPYSVLGHESGVRLLLRERFGCSECHNVREEGSVLTNYRAKWLVFIQNFAIQPCILFSWDIFLSFVGILRITNTIEISERFWCFSVEETTGSVDKRSKWMRSFRLFRIIIRELGFFNSFISLGFKRSRMRDWRFNQIRWRASKCLIVFARIIELVSNSIGNKTGEWFVSRLTWID
jgi:hypothetical protein